MRYARAVKTNNLFNFKRSLKFEGLLQNNFSVYPLIINSFLSFAIGARDVIKVNVQNRIHIFPVPFFMTYINYVQREINIEY